MRKKVLISWILSYLCILVIPITLGLLPYSQFLRVINDEVGKSYEISLEQLKH